MDIYHAIFKEWYWFVIVGSIVSLAFAPTFLKSRCPKCKNRNLRTVDLDQQTRTGIQEREQRAFLTFFRCNTCGVRLMRELTAPYEDASDSRWNAAFERAVVTVV